MRGRIVRHLGSNFPERDGGAVLVEAPEGPTFFYTPGGLPGRNLEVYGIELGKGGGYTHFARKVGYMMGIDGSPKEILEELNDELGVYSDEKDLAKKARSLEGRVEIAMMMAERGIFEDYDEDISYVPYEHIERMWVAPRPEQRHMGPEFRGLEGGLGKAGDCNDPGTFVMHVRVVRTGRAFTKTYKAKCRADAYLQLADDTETLREREGTIEVLKVTKK